LTTPEKGRMMDLLSLANQNAVNAFHIESYAEHHIENALQLLREKLGLKNLPGRMECFDISNISGKYAVGSLATFVNGRPFKEGYRRFRIKSLTGMDDYGMMREILRRHYEKKENLPDLAIVDGGKGQLGVAVALFRDLGIESVDLIGIAKESRIEKASSINKAQDRIYLPRRKDPVYLSRWPAALFLLQQIRDEAHRFALAYHHKLKEKSDFHSFLDDIPGIGTSRKKALLYHFGDINNIKAASPEQLQKVRGIGKELSVIINNLLTCREKG
jgi:excinuclease ABC subunit C